MPDWLVTLLVGLAGSAVGLIGVFAGIRKNDADASESISAAAGELVKNLRIDLAHEREARIKLEGRVEKIERQNADLCEQLRTVLRLLRRTWEVLMGWAAELGRMPPDDLRVEVTEALGRPPVASG